LNVRIGLALPALEGSGCDREPLDVQACADGAPLLPAWPALSLSGRVAIVAGNPPLTGRSPNVYRVVILL